MNANTAKIETLREENRRLAEESRYDRRTLIEYKRRNMRHAAEWDAAEKRYRAVVTAARSALDAIRHTPAENHERLLRGETILRTALAKLDAPKPASPSDG